jgi:hypothetical protein
MVGKSMSDNPLSGYFRQPAIYITLPSGGKYWPKDTIEIPETGELPVYPMTAIDEITYRTPDALFNGDAVVRVVQSCIPAIKNAWGMPACDIDSILTGIRIASYGHEMDIDTTCPNCNASSTFSLDLRQVVDSLVAPDYKSTVGVGDLEIHFKPLNYKQLTQNNLSQFQEQKTVAVLEDAEIDELEKLERLTEAFKKVSVMGLQAVAQTIHYIKTPETNVAEPQHIAEFLQQCDKSVFNRIRDHVLSINDAAKLKPLNIVCDECGHKWQQPFTLDMSDFFVLGS